MAGNVQLAANLNPRAEAASILESPMVEIDRLFYPDALPTPTYGTGGILWASLTLALLTVPVAIVATEEGLPPPPPARP